MHCHLRISLIFLLRVYVRFVTSDRISGVSAFCWNMFFECLFGRPCWAVNVSGGGLVEKKEQTQYFIHTVRKQLP